MITTNDLDAMLTADRDDYRKFARHIQECQAALEEAHKAHAYSGERNAIRATILDACDRIELPEVMRIVATLVNSTAWDGRIDPRNAEWAKRNDYALDEEAAKRLYIFNGLHPCHLDQIATELRRRGQNYFFSAIDGHYAYAE